MGRRYKSHEFRKQSIQCKKEKQLITGRCGGQIRGEPSRQTISKWETGETLPDIRQSKNLAVLYHVSLDELIEFDIELKEIEQAIENTNEEIQQKVDWTKVWAKKYPILTSYQEEVEVEKYAGEMKRMLESLKRDYGYNDTDAGLVLKDILAHAWNSEI